MGRLCEAEWQSLVGINWTLLFKQQYVRSFHNDILNKSTTVAWFAGERASERASERANDRDRERMPHKKQILDFSCCFQFFGINFAMVLYLIKG